MEKKVDLRIQKTKDAIHNAFKDLINNMDYNKITVKLLCDKAKINRKTFYLHYATMDDLLKEFQQEIVSSSAIEIYKQWVKDGRKIPLEEIIQITKDLVCQGVYNFMFGNDKN